MTFRSDGFFPLYADKNTSANFVGEKMPLFGAVAITVQAAAAGGSSGSLIVEGTNQPGATATYSQVSSTSLAANGSTLLSFSLSDTLTGMHAMRVRYVSAGTGTVTISLNIRRLAVSA